MRRSQQGTARLEQRTNKAAVGTPKAEAAAAGDWGKATQVKA